jgi:hypothetical protein
MFLSSAHKYRLIAAISNKKSFHRSPKICSGTKHEIDTKGSQRAGDTKYKISAWVMDGNQEKKR